MAYNPAIETKGLTKIYRLYRKPSDRLREFLCFSKKSFHTDFYALKEVDFFVNKGETIGIIGQNGSGKSTLLKILSGITFPTYGTFRTEGKISALLELGAGFNPEMTGIENIFFTGTIQGYSKREIEEKIPLIAEFADIGEYIYQPVKTYSSGMFVRLAFAVAVNIKPDIFLVDEALAVGDIAFQTRCFKKMRELQEKGTTIIFVTHALDTVIRYCNRALLLNKGEIVFLGDPKEAVDMYKCLMAKCIPDDKSAPPSDTKEQSSQKTLSYGNNKAEIIKVELLDEQSRKVNILQNGELFSIKMCVQIKQKIVNPIFAFTIKDVKGLEITGTNTMFKNISTGTFDCGEKVLVEFKQRLNCQSGRYALSVGCVGYENETLEVYHRLYDVIYFEVVSKEPMVGFFDLGSEIAVSKID